ncbi:type I restriction enzyme S subunit [Hypnocyclicus thermotrophus]|uniref:Type I restriction enzyme S subunit n=1 Tax=Hypnocyclicus thermotrophus TaxID=1627895 RepID=A0AA46E1E8_9FUSO|nr:restriction endonuclease subunit S [Hypnocyclicus thermotrophus]TDT72498.1 type I restriction enzyme S subunit [Hypnocyclicus thermotrophus]
MSADNNVPKGWVETTLGLFPEQWKIITAENFCIKIADGTHNSPKKTKEGKLLITSKNIKNSKLETSSAYNISIEDFTEINKRSKVDKWDILLSMIGTVGEVCLLNNKPDFAIKNVGLFKCGDETKAKWLFYFLISKIGQNYILSRLSGTTQKYITLGELRKFPIPVPPLQEQVAITKILTAFDDKIELLQAQNKTLETTAQTIFKEWFVEEAGEDWDRVSLGNSELSKIIGSGLTEFRGEKIYLATADVQNEKIVNTETFITFNKRPSRANMQPVLNSVWFAKKGSVRKVLMFDLNSKEEVEKYILSTGFSGLKTTNLSHYYIWLFVFSKEFQEIKDNLLSGSVQADINNDGIKNIMIPKPDNNILEKFNNIVEPLFHKIQKNNSQIQTLKQTRDTLLPKLMSGQLRVDEFKESAVC